MLTKTQSTKLIFNGEKIYVGIDTHKKNCMTSLAALQKCKCLLLLRMRPSSIKYNQDLAAPLL